MVTGANLASLRGSNDVAVLALTRGRADVSRTELARGLGVTPQAISKMLSRLMVRGLVAEAGTVTRGRGKPTTRYRLLPQARRAIGIQVNHLAVRGAVVDLAGKPLEIRVAGLDPSVTADELTERVGDMIDSLRDIGPGELVGIGVGLPGSVDPQRRVFRGAGPTDPWRDLALADLLEERCGLPVLVDNDSTAAVVAEAWADPAGTRDAALFLVEDGVGLGLQIDGRTVRGVHGEAGEVGHTVLVLDGEPCVCGRRGCAQAEHAAAWHRNLAVNLVGAALLVTALEPRLLAGGAVVNVGSIGAEYAGNAYSVAKAAVQAWSAGLAERLGPRGITVNAVAPGYVEGTDLFGGPVAERRRAALVARTLTGRPGTPEDVAALVEFLASPGARQITAQTLHLDGGAFTTR
jgi:NAD(P)-dependent dehydrogenase (short-subunit alcohol dehydrogenase family)